MWKALTNFFHLAKQPVGKNPPCANIMCKRLYSGIASMFAQQTFKLCFEEEGGDDNIPCSNQAP